MDFFLFWGSVLSKFVSPFITVYIFLYCLVNFEDLSWGVSHGATEEQKPLTEIDDPVKSTETLV